MNSSCRIAALASFSFAIAGSATAAEPDRSENPWSHWYIGSGIGPGFGAKYKLNGRSFSFDDGLQGATDKSPLIALNVVNAGIALSPNLLFGFSGSAASQIGKLNGNDAQLQINNYFAALTWFPAEKGFFLRGGAGLSSMLIDTGVSSNTAHGFGILVGAGYALPVARRHNITFTVDYSRQSYSGSSTKPDSSEFGAAYLGYMYRR
ncbi:MAG: hypothetical protein E6H42_09260 [Betaproteobacteria bacterium]|nr:MAG: hypothetical protein E6H42_09260 [Betaproteobacteria bacterium]